MAATPEPGGDRRRGVGAAAPRRRRAGFLALILVLATPSCAAFIEYTDDLRKSKEYTPIVRGLAKTGAFVGGFVSIPVDIAALPVTVSAYFYQDFVDPGSVTLIDSILFPSLFLVAAGTLVAVPADVLEYAFYRAWVPDVSLTAAEQEELEDRIDQAELPRYPVTPVYPKPRPK